MFRLLDTVVLSLVLLLHTTFSTANDLAFDAAKRNATAILSFDNISFNYTVKSGRTIHGVKQDDCNYEYQRFDSTFRIKWRCGNKWLDNVVVDHATVRSLSNLVAGELAPPDRLHGAVELYHGFPLSHGDPWFDFLFVFPNPGKLKPALLETVLESAPSKITLTTKDVSGEHGNHLILRIDTKTAGIFSEFWFDKDRNYLISNYIASNRAEARETRIEQFVEPAPGVYFPSVIVVERRLEGKETKTTTYRCSDIRLNQLNELSLELPFPNNTYVRDVQGNRRYTVGKDGERKGESTYDLKPVDGTTDLPVEKDKQPEPTPTPQPVTKTEPVSLSKLMLTATLFLAIIALSVAVYTRARNMRRGNRE